LLGEDRQGVQAALYLLVRVALGARPPVVELHHDRPSATPTEQADHLWIEMAERCAAGGDNELIAVNDRSYAVAWR
jgi:hypothetical protein